MSNLEANAIVQAVVPRVDNSTEENFFSDAYKNGMDHNKYTIECSVFEALHNGARLLKQDGFFD